MPFLMGFGGFMLYANVFILIDISSEIVRNDMSFWKMFPFIMQQIPRYIPQAIPVGVLLSIFWLLSKLESKNEIIAFQVHGIKLKKIVTPFLIFGLILSIATYLLKEQVVPEMYRNKNAEVFLSSGLHKFMLSEENRYMFIKRVYSNRKELVDVFIYDIDKENKSMKVYYSPQITFDENKSLWDLSNMKVYKSVDDSKMLPETLSAEDAELVRTDIEFYFMVTKKKAYNMKSDELLQIIDEYKERGIYNTDSFSFEIEFHTRYAQSLGPLVVAILGVPLSLALNIKSKAWSVIFTFLLIALYQGSSQWMAAMGRSDYWSPWHLNPIVGAWGPDILFSVIGIVFYMLLDTEILYSFKEKIARFSGD
jgi:lipopolysaccharide export LptBFGC system permease protein LptF